MLAPILSFAWAVPEWVPANDPALMGIQALEVGSAETPLTGQPSTSARYVEEDRHVDHPGPLHFYLLAAPMRLLGAELGMLSVSLLINGACLLIAAWAVFRRLGPVGGVIGAVLLGLVSFTTGAAHLVDPVSSEIARYPLLCSSVLIWCLLCGDIRLLPLTTGVVSFAAQQHLSVLPAIAVLTVAGVAGFVYMWGRGGRWREHTARRALAVWGGWSAILGLVLWSPVLLQQITGRPGNLTMLVRLTGDEDRPRLGVGSAVRQVAHVLGLPPLLGRTELTGLSFLDDVSLLTWLSAGLVAAVLVALAVRWRQISFDRFTMVLMVGLLVVVGVVTGSNVLDSEEAWRLIMYHWAFPLAFFVALCLGMAAFSAIAWLAHRTPSHDRIVRGSWVWTALAGIALLAIVVPSLINPSLDRRSNTMAVAHSPIERRYVDELVTELMTHRDRLDDGPILMLSHGAAAFSGLRDTLALYLAADGLDVKLPREFRWYVPDRRLADPATTEAALLVVEDHLADHDDPAFRDVIVGELLADVNTAPRLDLSSYRTLLERFDGIEELRLGSAVESALGDIPDPWLRAVESGDLTALDHAPESAEPLPARAMEQVEILLRLFALRNEPAQYLLDRELLEFLVEHPLEEPELDGILIASLLETAPDELRSDRPMRVRAYLLGRDEALAFVGDQGLGE